MEVALDFVFDEQRIKYRFRYTCEDCVHFNSQTEQCIHEYPNQMHRQQRYELGPKPKTIIFCKEFDLV